MIVYVRPADDNGGHDVVMMMTGDGVKKTYEKPLAARIRFMGQDISVTWTLSNMGASWAVVAPSPAPRSSIRSAR